MAYGLAGESNSLVVVAADELGIGGSPVVDCREGIARA
jgi:hypothetical protein